MLTSGLVARGDLGLARGQNHIGIARPAGYEAVLSQTGHCGANEPQPNATESIYLCIFAPETTLPTRILQVVPRRP